MKFRRLPKEINIISHDPKDYIRIAADMSEAIAEAMDAVIERTFRLVCVVIAIPLLFITLPIAIAYKIVSNWWWALKYMTYNTTPELDKKVQEVITRKRGDSK